MKRIVIAVPLILAVLIAVLLIAPGFIDWNQYKAQAQTQVKSMTGLDLTLAGPVGLSLLPFPQVHAEDVSIAAPAGSKFPQAIALKRAEINVDLLPLLSGKVSVHSLTLVSPQIALEKKADGKLNIMTPELEALTGASEPDQNGEAAPASSASSQSSAAVTVQSFKIVDGSFAYYDAEAGEEQKFEGINAELSLKDVAGPYWGEGSFGYAGGVYGFDLKTERYNAEAKILPLNMNLSMQNPDAEVKFGGSLDFSKDFLAQGEVQLQAKNVADANIGEAQKFLKDISFKGFLNADATQVQVKDINASLSGQKIEGNIALVLTDPATVQARLKTADSVDLAGVLPGLPNIKTGAFDVGLSGSLDKMGIQDSFVTLNDSRYEITGAYTSKTKTGRSELLLNLKTSVLKTADFLSEEDKAEKKKSTVISDGSNNAQEMAFKNPLPFDLILSADFGKLIHAGQTFSKVGLEAVVMQNALNLKRLELSDADQSRVKAVAQIANLSALSGIEAQIDVSTKDIKKTAALGGVDPASLPQGLTAADIKAKVSGDQNKLDALVNVSASGATVAAQAKLIAPMALLSIDDLVLQVKHKDTAQFVQLLTGAAQSDENLRGPLDLYAAMNMKTQDVYSLSEIKGNLAGSSLNGSAMLDMSKDKPYLKGDFTLGELTMGDAAITAQNSKSSKSAAKSSGGAQQGERWSKEPIDATALNALDADLSFKARKVAYSGWVLDQPKATINLKDGDLTFSDVEAGMFGGKVAMKSTIMTAAQPRQPVHLTVDATAQGIDMSKLVVALTGTQLVKVIGHGDAAMSIKASGLSPAALVYDLNGTATVNGKDITLDGVDVERFAVALSEESKPGDSALGLWKGVSKGGSTSFDVMDGQFEIVEGIVNIQKLVLDGEKAQILMTGKVDLPRWQLATKHKITAKTKPDVPPFDMAFSGSLDNPGQTFGQGLLNDYLKRKVDRKINKLLSDKLGDKLGIPLGGAQQQQQAPVAPAPAEVAPAGGAEPQQQEAIPAEQPPQEQQAAEPAPVEQQEELKPEDAIKDVLKGLLQ